MMQKIIENDGQVEQLIIIHITRTNFTQQSKKDNRFKSHTKKLFIYLQTTIYTSKWPIVTLHWLLWLGHKSNYKLFQLH